MTVPLKCCRFNYLVGVLSKDKKQKRFNSSNLTK